MDFGDALGGVDPGRLEDGDSGQVLCRPHRDGGGSELAAAAGGFVGLSDDRGNFVPVSLRKVRERWETECAGSEEDEPHGWRV